MQPTTHPCIQFETTSNSHETVWIEQSCSQGKLAQDSVNPLKRTPNVYLRRVWLGMDPRMDTQKDTCSKEIGFRAQN